MSTDNSVATPKRESLFSKKNRKLLKDPLSDSNPITIQVLGICSALAITVQLATSRYYEFVSSVRYDQWKRHRFLAS